MRILRQVLGKEVELGGEEHTGWLPLNSAVPRAIPVERVSLDVRILETEGGVILEWKSKDNAQSNDSWHSTLEDAQHDAQDQFGIKESEWEVVS